MQSLETKSSRPRPKSFETETETRPETFKTETESGTPTNGSRDTSRDRVQFSRLHQWELAGVGVQNIKLLGSMFSQSRSVVGVKNF